MTTTAEILTAVHHATGTTPQELTETGRTSRVATARFLAMRLYHETHPWSSNQDAAKAVGKLDPSTGRHGLMRAAFLLENDADFKAAYDSARNELNQPKPTP